MSSSGRRARTESCGGHALAPAEVSGYATLIGFTVSHRFTHPGLPSPYVVAQVALEEDPRVRLITNAVQCSPEDLSLGMRMEVVFEQAGDVWLPLFRPCASQPPPAGLPEDDPAPGEHWRHVRPMITTEKFEDKAVITGIGQSLVGRRLMRSPVALAVEAAERAVADAGLTMADIDGLATYPGGLGYNGISEGGVSALQSALELRPRRDRRCRGHVHRIPQGRNVVPGRRVAQPERGLDSAVLSPEDLGISPRSARSPASAVIPPSRRCHYRGAAVHPAVTPGGLTWATPPLSSHCCSFASSSASR